MGPVTALFFNGNVVTMDAAQPRGQALLARNGRIEAVGHFEDLQRFATPGMERVDLGGGTVIPGFNDCHCHILTFGITLDQFDVSADSVESIADIQRRVKDRAARASPDEWIVGRGYDQNRLTDQRHPTREDLDAVSTSNPILLWHTSRHALACNTRALQVAGVGQETATPPGGDIERDESGIPTGVFKETPAMDLISLHIPPPTHEQGRDAILRAMQAMAAEGITSACDADTGFGDSLEPGLRMYQAAARSERRTGRVTSMPNIRYVAPVDTDTCLRYTDLAHENVPDWFRVGAVKIYADGALTTRTAALRASYTNQTSSGLLLWEPKALADLISRAHGGGWQIGTHAIGDRAVELVVECYERALETMPRANHRHRIEHCMALNEPLANRIKRSGLVPTIQPGFVGRLGDAYITALGHERATQLMPMQIFGRLNIPIGFSSDRPVIPGAPLDGVRSAIARTTPNGVSLGPEHNISVMKAIEYYTSGSAYSTHFDREVGVLRKGMLADFTVLSQDPSTATSDQIDQMGVNMTVVGGRVVYRV